MTIPLLLSALLTNTAEAGSTWLTNDDFTGEGKIAFQDGFATYECWGSVFSTDELTADGPLTMKSVRALIGPSGDNYFIMQFFAMSGSDMNTAVMIAEEGIAITGSAEYYNDLQIADLDLGLPQVNSGDIAVSVCFDDKSTSSPTIANTNSFSDPTHNWIYLPSHNYWVKSADLGVQGDWVMRLCVEADHISGSCDNSSDTVDGGGGGNDGGGGSDGGDDTGSDAISVLQITPTSAAEGEAVDVIILGSGFVDGAEARIGGISLTGTEVVNGETVIGRTPTSLPAGEHDVEVVLPSGDTDYIAGGFTVGGGCGCATSSAPGRSGVLLFSLLGMLLWWRRTP